jgi:cytochrome c556
MNYRLIAWMSLGLWLATVVVFAVLFVRGSTAPATDGRRAILLSPAERDLVLAEMRTMLTTVQGIVQGVHDNDLKRVAAAARASGMQAAVDTNPALMAKLPLEFKQLGMSVHHGFDDLADAIDGGKAGRDEVLRQLGTQLVTCVACHQSFRIDPGPAR